MTCEAERRWVEMDEDERVRWAQTVAADVDEARLRKMILATAAGRGELALPSSSRGAAAAVSLSRAAALVQELNRRRGGREGR